MAKMYGAAGDRTLGLPQIGIMQSGRSTTLSLISRRSIQFDERYLRATAPKDDRMIVGGIWNIFNRQVGLLRRPPRSQG